MGVRISTSTSCRRMPRSVVSLPRRSFHSRTDSTRLRMMMCRRLIVGLSHLLSGTNPNAELLVRKIPRSRVRDRPGQWRTGSHSRIRRKRSRRRLSQTRWCSTRPDGRDRSNGLETRSDISTFLEPQESSLLEATTLGPSS